LDRWPRLEKKSSSGLTDEYMLVNPDLKSFIQGNFAMCGFGAACTNPEPS
jgi:hypothetical protein